MSIHRWIGSSLCAAAVALCAPAATYAQHYGHSHVHGGGWIGGGGSGGIGYGGLAAPYGGYSGLHHHSHHFYGGSYYSPYGSRTYFSPFGLGYGYSSFGLGYPQLSLGYSIGRLYQPYYGLYGSGLYGSGLYGSGLYGSGLYGLGSYGLGSYGSYFGSYYPGYYSGNLYSNGFYNSLYGGTMLSPLLTVPSTNALLDAAMLNGRYLRAARTAFSAGDYAKAQKLVNHSILETPGDAKSHEMLSLTQFAQGDYQGASAAAHKAAELAPVADWKTLYGYYGDESKYVTHLNALTKFIKENPGSADARFLIAIHLLMMGHKEPAKQQFAEYLKLVPGDPVAEKLSLQLASDKDSLPAPSTPATAPAPADPAPADPMPAVPAPAETPSEFKL